ncbi:MAG: glycosyltransferase family 4 protein [Planctomycetota bacterium]|nr:glycosyltransferase family 4 protein [Planctomycetota bacterium]
MSEKMTIGYLTSVYPRASDTFIRGEVEELRGLGHTVHTFSVRRPDKDQIVSDDVRTERNNTTYLLGGPHRLLLASLRHAVTNPARFSAALGAAWRLGPQGLRARLWQFAYVAEACILADEWKRLNIDHVHNHIAENSATVAMLAAMLIDRPWSMTVHGPGIFFAPQRWGLGEKISRTAFTACISDFCRSQCMIFAPREHWSKLEIVRCGLAAADLTAEPAPIPGEPRLVSVGRLCEAKGQPLIVEALARLAKEGVRFNFTFVGDGPLRRDIERQIRDHGLEDSIHIAGWQNRDRVREELRAARALVLPSFAEGLPVVIMEALAMGRPVLSTQIAAIPELVRTGETGWLVTPGSIDDLTNALRELLAASPADLDRLGQRGMQLVRERHDAAREAAKLAGLFARAAGRVAADAAEANYGSKHDSPNPAPVSQSERPVAAAAGEAVAERVGGSR